MKHVLFFATHEDLVAVLDDVERGGSLNYTRAGQFATRELGTSLRGAEIPGLGKADCESAIGCASFLVTEPGLTIAVRPIASVDGTERHSVDQLHNPDTVTFTPGGIWNDDVLLHGRVATASTSELSQVLMKRFHSAFRAHFTKTKAFLVGGGARALLHAGKRLTMAAQSPRDFDLTE